MIKIELSGGEIESIAIRGVELTSDDGIEWHTPKKLLNDILVNDLPENTVFSLCDYVDHGCIFLDSIPTYLQRIANDKVQITFEDSGTRKHWDGQVGFKPYMESKKIAIDELAKEINFLKFKSYDDDGNYIFLRYSAVVEATSCNTIIDFIEQIIGEIEGTVEISLGGQVWRPDIVQDEKEFTLEVVLPILRKLGFCNVQYNHGGREYGRDVIFARQTEFGEFEYCAAQVKFGDVSGGANSEIDIILGQVDDAFKMPFFNIYTRGKQRISKLAIIISGKFTNNAIEKICEKVEHHATKNNLIFIDGEKIKTLIEHIRVSP